MLRVVGYEKPHDLDLPQPATAPYELTAETDRGLTSANLRQPVG
jgi:hypothetical protein